MIVVPTSGQLQVPGSRQSFARIILTVADNAAVTETFTSAGEPPGYFPDAGYIAWRYVFQGARRYGRRLPIQFKEQFIPTDIAEMEIDQLLVVLKSGVTASVSIRRFST